MTAIFSDIHDLLKHFRKWKCSNKVTVVNLLNVLKYDIFMPIIMKGLFEYVYTVYRQCDQFIFLAIWKCVCSGANLITNIC